MSQKFNMPPIGEKMHITTVLRYCNFLQIFTYLNTPALYYKKCIYVFGWKIIALQAFDMS
jgi:hypothetical protein